MAAAGAAAAAPVGRSKIAGNLEHATEFTQEVDSDGNLGVSQDTASGTRHFVWTVGGLDAMVASAKFGSVRLLVLGRAWMLSLIRTMDTAHSAVSVQVSLLNPHCVKDSHHLLVDWTFHVRGSGIKASQIFCPSPTNGRAIVHSATVCFSIGYGDLVDQTDDNGDLVMDVACAPWCHADEFPKHYLNWFDSALYSDATVKGQDSSFVDQKDAAEAEAGGSGRFRIYRAHRIVMANMSAVFKRNFASVWADSKEIDLSRYPPDATLIVMKHAYGWNIQNNMMLVEFRSGVMEALFEMSHMYEIKPIFKYASRMLVDVWPINKDTIRTMKRISDLYEIDGLKHRIAAGIAADNSLLDYLAARPDDKPETRKRKADGGAAVEPGSKKRKEGGASAGAAAAAAATSLDVED